jgi:hypothetical protein
MKRLTAADSLLHIAPLAWLGEQEETLPQNEIDCLDEQA